MKHNNHEGSASKRGLSAGGGVKPFRSAARTRLEAAGRAPSSAGSPAMPHGRGLPSGERPSLATAGPQDAPRRTGGLTPSQGEPRRGVGGGRPPPGVRDWPRTVRGGPGGLRGAARSLTSLGAGRASCPDAGVLAKASVRVGLPCPQDRAANPQGLQRYALLPSGRRVGACLTRRLMRSRQALPRAGEWKVNNSISRHLTSLRSVFRVGQEEQAPAHPPGWVLVV